MSSSRHPRRGRPLSTRPADPLAPDRIEAALGLLARLEPEFVSLTNRPAYRNPGRTYAGRGLVYVECRRDVTLELGPAAVERIGPVLGLIARMARWFTFRIAVALAADLRAIFAAQERKRVPLHVFWRLTEPLFAQETPVCVAGAAERLRGRGEKGSLNIRFIPLDR